MAKLPLSDLDHAALHAARKEIDKILDGVPNIPHGIDYQLEGQRVMIEFNHSTVVRRESGVNNDGRKERRATPLLYGRMIWGMLKERLEIFNQWNAVERVIVDLLNDVLTRIRQGGNDVRKELDDRYGEEWVEYLEDTFQDIPCLECDTERRIAKERPPTITVESIADDETDATDETDGEDTGNTDDVMVF